MLVPTLPGVKVTLHCVDPLATEHDPDEPNVPAAGVEKDTVPVGVPVVGPGSASAAVQVVATPMVTEPGEHETAVADARLLLASTVAEPLLVPCTGSPP